LNEEVDVVDYDPRWVRLFEHERERICGGISVTPCRMEHIGSTAIPGLIAKPIVDLMLGVEPFPLGSSLIFEIESLGYEALGEAGVSGRLYFRRRGAESFNLHVVRHGGDHWVSDLALRAYLLAHPAECRDYAKAKKRALGDGHRTLLSYSEAKGSVVSALISRAKVWANAT
jgi:GrpB-like predicted nucleotidyltransferase (UPF0157 family)